MPPAAGTRSVARAAPASRGRVALLLLGVLAACHPGAAAVRLDLQAYLQHMRLWAPVEAETARTLERILATQFVDEAEVRHQIADSRPRLRAHLERIRAYQPRTPPLQRIHARYVRAWQDLLSGYDAIEKGFTTGDYTNLARGREAMAAWRDGITGVAHDLRALADDLGVEPPAGPASIARNDEGPTPHPRVGPSPRRSGGVLLSHTATVQYHRRWRA